MVILAFLPTSGNIERDLGRAQSKFFSATGNASFLALPPLVIVAVLAGPDGRQQPPPGAAGDGEPSPEPFRATGAARHPEIVLEGIVRELSRLRSHAGANAALRISGEIAICPALMSSPRSPLPPSPPVPPHPTLPPPPPLAPVPPVQQRPVTPPRVDAVYAKIEPQAGLSAVRAAAAAAAAVAAHDAFPGIAQAEESDRGGFLLGYLTAGGPEFPGVEPTPATLPSVPLRAQRVALDVAIIELHFDETVEHAYGPWDRVHWQIRARRRLRTYSATTTRFRPSDFA